MGKEKHYHENQQLDVCVFREELGYAPGGYANKLAKIPIPDDMIIHGIDSNKLEFLKTIKTARKHIDREMRKIHAEVNWNHQCPTELRVKCTIAGDEKDFRILVRDWKNSVLAAMNIELNDIHVKDRLCSKTYWDSICEKLVSVKENNSKIAIIADPGDNMLFIVGKGNEVDKVYEEVDCICSKKDNRGFMPHFLVIPKFQMAVIVKTKLLEQLRTRYNGLSVEVDNDKIVCTGPASFVGKAISSITDYQRSMKHRRPKDLSKSQKKVVRKFLKHPNSLIDGDIADEQAIICTVKRGISLIGTDEGVRRCEEILRNDIVEEIISLTPEEQTAFKQSEWQHFRENMQEMNQRLFIQLLDESTTLKITTHTKQLTDVVTEVTAYIKKNQIRTLNVDTEKSIVRFLSHFMRNEIAKIETSLAPFKVKIQPNETGLSFSISGLQAGLQEACLKFKQLSSRIQRDTHTITSFGMPYYFTQDAAQYKIKSWEGEHKAIIEILDPTKRNDNISKHRTEVEHVSGVMARAVFGDITSLKVDAIINAANGTLQHAAGLAKAIVDRGNRSLTYPLM